MANEVETTQKNINDGLKSALTTASSIITKDYLSKLEKYDIINPSEEDIDIDIAECGKFYKLSNLVVNKEENFLDKLTTIVNVATSINCSIATIINSNGSKIDYYIGIISKNERDFKEASVKRRLANATAFRGALQGNLIGSELNELTAEEVENLRKLNLSKRGSCYSAISGVVALRHEKDKSFERYVQGIENLVDSLKGLKYTVVMIADSVDTAEIQVIKQGYEMIHTHLTTFARNSVTINESDTLSLSKARTEGISEGISKGIAMTQSKTNTRGKYLGGSIGIGIGFGPIFSANVGVNAGTNRSTAETIDNTNTTTDPLKRTSQ